MFGGAVGGGSAGRRSGWEARLAAAAPGAELAGLLASVVESTLDAYDRVEVVRAHERLASWVAASQARAIAAVDAAVTPPDGGDCSRDDRWAR